MILLAKVKEEEHRKYFNKQGKEIPSCTTIVGLLGKPELVNWANYMGFKKINTKELLEEKATYGTYCHKLFEHYFSNGLMSAKTNDTFLSKDEYRLIIYKFRMVELYFEKLRIRVINQEMPLEGDTYGGTLDMLCYNEKEDCLMIFDLKTSKRVYQSHWIQLMGYVQLLEEIYELPVKYVGVILLSEDLRSPKLVNINKTKDMWRELTIFNKLRDIYYYLNAPEEVIEKTLKGDIII